MPLSDILIVFNWWFYLLVIGLIFLPITNLLFNNFIDKGYIFAKTIGLISISYLVLVLGEAHILQFSRINLIFLLLFFIILNLLIPKLRNSVRHFNRREIYFFAFEESIFLIGLLAFAFVRGTQPDIEGLEKYMDFGFVNSILRSTYFPPKDMWFTGFDINYYYFGHLITAVITKLSSIPASISFNLMLANLFSLTLVSSFSLGLNIFDFSKKVVNLKLKIAAGLVVSFLVTIAGNLHTVYTFFKPYDTEKAVPPWNLGFSPLTFPNSYWYPNATRFIYNTIHEFPSYSWIVSDLHGHVLDIPIVLLTISVFFALFTSEKINKIFLVFIGFLLSIMYMTNAWDGIIYFLFAGLIFLLFFVLKKDKFTRSAFQMAIILGSFFLFTLPFNYFFKPFVSGIGILCAPQFLVKIGKIGPFLFESNHCQTSPLWQLLILYGFFYFFVFSFFIYLLRRRHHPEDTFLVLLIILSTSLIILPELIYAKDIYPAHFRANTMFKLVYQSFIMLSIVSGITLIKILITNPVRKKMKVAKAIWIIPAFTLLFFVAIYSYFGIYSYYNQMKDYKGLNGTNYLSNRAASDLKTINWINKNIKGQPVILEAQGDSYTEYARISANTGLPTVLGWTVHEWLWRGSYDVPAPRINEIKEMYENPSSDLTLGLLKKYRVAYVYVGRLEKEKYPNIQTEKFKNLGKEIFKTGESSLYKINL